MTLPSDAAAEGGGYFGRFARAAAGWAGGVALWYPLTLLFSPSILALWRAGGSCFASPFVQSTSACLSEGIFLAPVIFLLGPIAHDAEDPPNLWPTVLLIALLLATTLQALTLLALRLLMRRRARRLDGDEARS